MLHTLKRKWLAVKKNERGLTLVELLIAVGIFSIAIGIISQTFVTAIRMQKRFLASTESLNEISYLMEYMARFIRMAKKDKIPTCLSAQNANFEITHGGKGIKMKTYNNKCQEFYLDDSTQTLMEVREGVENPLTSPKIDVVSFNIGPTDSWDQDDHEQPRVTLFLELRASDGSRIKLQTSISQRNPDIQL